jgi:hypothetical protein
MTRPDERRSDLDRLRGLRMPVAVVWLSSLAMATSVSTSTAVWRSRPPDSTRLMARLLRRTSRASAPLVNSATSLVVMTASFGCPAVGRSGIERVARRAVEHCKSGQSRHEIRQNPAESRSSRCGRCQALITDVAAPRQAAGGPWAAGRVALTLTVQLGRARTGHRPQDAEPAAAPRIAP